MKVWLLLLATLAALSVQFTACNYCDADEERAVSVSAVDSLTIAYPERTLRLAVGGRVGQTEVTSTQFRALFEPLEGNAGGAEAIVFSLSERDPVTGELVSLTLAVPATLRRGERYTVGAAFTVPIALTVHETAWGGRDLIVAHQAEVAFSTSTYSFPPPQHTMTFVATQAAGTVEVTRRGSGFVELALSLRLTNESGRVVNVSGRVHAQAERHTPPCT